MKIVFATSNPGKLEEFRALVERGQHEFMAQGALGVEDAEETGTTFTENALIKARHASLHTGLPAIADDSGLEVDYLNGRPGIFSARYAGSHATDQENINRLLEELQGIPMHRRSARFQCVIALVNQHDQPDPVICHGVWEGKIAVTQSGTHGFGYDPVFIADGFDCTSATLPPKTKNRVSHRAHALAKLKTYLNNGDSLLEPLG